MISVRAVPRWATGDRLAAIACVVILAVFALVAGDPYTLRLVSLAGISTLLVLGYQLVFGHTGSLSLAHGAFFAIGAYTAALLSIHHQLDSLLTIPAAIGIAVVVASVLAVPALRLRSHSFALATLAFAQIVLLAALHGGEFTGGANGLSGVGPLEFAGWVVPRGWPRAIVVWLIAGAAMLVVFAMTRGYRSDIYAMARDTPQSAQSVGVSPQALRYQTFIVGAALAGTAGALQAHIIGVVSPEVAHFEILVTCLAMTVIGGSYRIAGAVLGAVLLIHLPEWFRFLEGWYLLAYGVALLATIIFFPRGIAGLLQGKRVPTPIASLGHETSPNPDSNQSKTALRVRHLSKRFGGVQAVDDVSLHLKPGEILGLIGPNGSGKSTLLNLISGFEKPDAGDVHIAKTPISGRLPSSRARLGIGRTFQTPELSPHLTVGEVVALPARATGRRLNLGHLLGIAGLAQVAETPCASLAPGQSKRVEIARALSLSPEILLLDEPAAGLGEKEQGELANLVRRLASQGLAILVIDHSMSFLLPLADRVICMNEGQIIATGTAEEIRSNPAVQKAYLGGSSLHGDAHA